MAPLCSVSLGYQRKLDVSILFVKVVVKSVNFVFVNGGKGVYDADIYRPTNADATNQNLTHVTTVTIPYIKGTSETISRILQPYHIRVAHKPTTTLRHLLTNVKDRDEPNNRQGAVYKIKCSDCQASYIGETGRNLNTRLTEHIHMMADRKLEIKSIHLRRGFT